MKFLLIFLVFISLDFVTQSQESVEIQFVQDQDSFPDCKTIFYANGRYALSKQKLIEVKLPNTISVLPSSLTLEYFINFRSFALEAKKFGSIELDEYQIISYTREQVKDLLRRSIEDSAHYEWLMRDNDYLLKNFNVILDAKPTPDPVVKDTAKPKPQTGPINVTSGILDGVYIDERKYIRIEYLGAEHIPTTFHEQSEKVRKHQVQPKLDSLFQPFYFSNYEVTNGEYREFINWVSDSVELRMAYDNLDDQNAMLLVDCTKKQREYLIPIIRRDENREQYGLSRRNRKKISDSAWVSATEGMYHMPPRRYYKRRYKNTGKLIYKLPNRKEIAIYPDTTGFLKIDEIGFGSGFLSNLTWHPAFEDYPVVNVSNEQIMAYCQWKQHQLNNELKKDGIRITVRPPTITEYEFALKASLGPEGYSTAMDKSNRGFTSFNRDYNHSAFLFYQNVHYSPFQKKSLTFNGYPSLDYKQWYKANQSNSSVKFLNGNVSEFVMDEVTIEKLEHYQLDSSKTASNAHFVLGANYIQDVKSLGDDQYNATFYKTTLKNGVSSPLVGFRLVYFVQEIE